MMDRVYETGEPYFASERLVKLDRDGDGVTEDYWYNLGYQPLRDAAGRVYAIASVAYEVTDQMRARRELEAAKQSAEEARVEAVTANQAKSAFLTTMSHELRTPLNAVAGYSDLLLMGVRGALTDGQREDLERIKRSGQYLLGLINDVLNFAKLDAGQVEYRFEDVRLSPLLDGLEELIRPQVDAKGLRYQHGSCGDDLVLRADPEKTRQILLNLLANAVKFTEPGGEVTLVCTAEQDVVRMTVHDTGRGIAPDQLTRVFDPFVQVDRHLTPMSQQGVGLGLAISRDLASGMGGALEAKSEVGRGSEFTLTLPRVGADRRVTAEGGRRAARYCRCGGAAFGVHGRCGAAACGESSGERRAASGAGCGKGYRFWTADEVRGRAALSRRSKPIPTPNSAPHAARVTPDDSPYAAPPHR